MGDPNQRHQTPQVNSTVMLCKEGNLKYITLYLLIASSLLLGCQSTGVIPMDQDSYYVGKKDGSPGIGVSLSNKQKFIKKLMPFVLKRGSKLKCYVK